MEGTEATRFDNVRLREDGRAGVILDQTELPGRTVYRELCTAEDVYRAIRTLQVRGAPAIGICAAYGIACAAKSIREREFDAFFERFRACRMYLESSRPTAVNLSWALRREGAVCASGTAGGGVAASAGNGSAGNPGGGLPYVQVDRGIWSLAPA